MQAILATFLLLHGPAQASEASFQSAFHALMQLRGLEEERAMLAAQPEVNEAVRRRESERLSKAMAQAQQELASIRDAASLTPWERSHLAKPGQPALPARGRNGPADPAALDFLARAFPQPRTLSPLAWQVLSECFGNATQEAFLRNAFSMKELASTPPAGEEARLTLLWVTNPYERFLSKTAATKERESREKTKARLERDGYRLELLELSAYPAFDDQAEELRHTLSTRLETGSYLLVSTGEASSILHRTFDLNPELLQRPSIRGWVNVNGKLFGHAPPRAGRKPSSMPAKAADLPERQAEQALFLRHQDTRLPPAPLNARFPVLNLISLEPAHRPTENLRESLEAEGRTLVVGTGDALESLALALPLLKATSGH